MTDHKTIDQRLREWCGEMRSEGYSEEDIFYALLEESQRIGQLGHFLPPTNDPAPDTIDTGN